MGYCEISLKLPPDYSAEQLRQAIARELKIKEFTFQISTKSLDARKKTNIHWVIRAGVLSTELSGGVPEPEPELNIPTGLRRERAVVVGSGPAGFFAAYVLQKAGIGTSLIERGADVTTRAEGIRNFEQTGIFDPVSNYAFGEGGAGTFSDGKLTSRTKSISMERKFVLDSYVSAGAPEEIKYLAHPHLGTDNLKVIVRNLREAFIAAGGTIMFGTMLEDIVVASGSVSAAVTSAGLLEADYFVIAPGHSAYETYRMLMQRGIQLRVKPFAIGSRVEHHQSLINRAQWGCQTLPGVKAAEYRLTSQSSLGLPVYTFCMCPGGIVVPATAYHNNNIVNGMSRYRRDGEFANSACVAGVNLPLLLGRDISAVEALDWVASLEEGFYEYAGGYAAPFCSIQDFINRKVTATVPGSSYPLGLKAAPLWDMLPSAISRAMAEGLKDFSRKIRGFETGTIMGLESKTSSPVQVLRSEGGLCNGFSNLYISGEGSGYAGGIISSAADGIKSAMHIISSLK